MNNETINGYFSCTQTLEKCLLIREKIVSRKIWLYSTEYYTVFYIYIYCIEIRKK